MVEANNEHKLSCDVCGARTNLGRHVFWEGDQRKIARCLCAACRLRYLEYMREYEDKARSYEIARKWGRL